MGISPNHATNVPLVLDITTGSITPKFHVVFDDYFATVTTETKDIPDFNSDEWAKLFGNIDVSQFHADEPADLELVSQDNKNWNRTLKFDADNASNCKYVLDAIPSLQSPRTLDPPSHQTEPSTNDNPVQLQLDNQNGMSQPQSPKPSPSSVHQPDTPVNATKDDQQLRSSAETSSPLSPSPPTPTLRRSQCTRQKPAQLNMQPNLKSYADVCITQSQTFDISTAYTEAPISDSVQSSDDSPAAAFMTVSDIPNGNHYAYASSKSKSDLDTFTWDEAMASENVTSWKEAAGNEIKELVENRDTWSVVDMSEAGKSKILPTTWVFRLKHLPDGNSKKFKGRLVVRGDLQEVIYEVYAPVVQFSSVRFFLIFSMAMDWITCAIDFCNAFFQTDFPSLMEPVFLHPPRGYYQDIRRKSILKLKKSMYRLRDAPRLWYQNLFQYLLLPELGFTQSRNDPCLLFRLNMIIIVYVDDMGVAAINKTLIDELITFLCSHGLDLQREGTFQHYLGIRFSALPNGSVHMTQMGLIKKIITATGMEDCNPNKVPALKACLAKDHSGEAMTDAFNYRSVVGMLLYLSG